MNREELDRYLRKITPREKEILKGISLEDCTGRTPAGLQSPARELIFLREACLWHREKKLW